MKIIRIDIDRNQRTVSKGLSEQNAIRTAAVLAIRERNSMSNDPRIEVLNGNELHIISGGYTIVTFRFDKEPADIQAALKATLEEFHGFAGA